jgi:AcrR family transcriptional regulator
MEKDTEKQSNLSKRNERKIRILNVALDLMIKHGYKGATTKKIAEMAGVHEMTLFRYFKNKKAILRGLIEDAKFLSISRLFNNFENQKFSSIEELMDKFSEVAFESFLLNKNLFLLFLKEVGNEQSEFYKLHLKGVTKITNIVNKKITELNKREKFNKTDLKNASYIYHAATLGSFYWYVINEKKISKSSMKSFIKNITKILIYGIKKSS